MSYLKWDYSKDLKKIKGTYKIIEKMAMATAT